MRSLQAVQWTWRSPLRGRSSEAHSGSCTRAKKAATTKIAAETPTTAAASARSLRPARNVDSIIGCWSAPGANMEVSDLVGQAYERFVSEMQPRHCIRHRYCGTAVSVWRRGARAYTWTGWWAPCINADGRAQGPAIENREICWVGLAALLGFPDAGAVAAAPGARADVARQTAGAGRRLAASARAPGAAATEIGRAHV